MKPIQHRSGHFPSCLLAVLMALLTFTASALAGQAGNSPVKIYIMIGQSNMLGHGNISPATTQGTLQYVVANDPGGNYQFLVDGDGDWVVRDDVWIKDQYGNASGLTAGYGSGATVPASNLPPFGSKVGPELGFGHAMGGFYDEQILLVKAAWGGKSLGGDFRPPSSGWSVNPPVAEGDQGFYYKQVLSLVNDAIANLGTYFPGYNSTGGYEIAGICWHQGWNDRVTPAFSAAYQTNMANFIRDIRTDLGIPNLNFVIATSAMDGDGPTAYTQVELGQRAMTNPYLTNANPTDLYTDFVGSVAVVDCRQIYNGWNHTGLAFWQPAANSPSAVGYHWNNNAKTYLNIGLAMADEMSALAPPPCPSSLRASAGVTSGVALSWLNWDNIPTSVKVLRDGVEVAAALPGATTSFADTTADPGILDYQLVFTMPGDPCAPLTVTFDGSITGLEAVRSGGGVSLTWSNAMVYPGIKVLRNGVIIQPNLVGTSESFIDPSPLPSGSVIYQVEPTTGTSTPAQARIKPSWGGGNIDIAIGGDGISNGGSGTWDATVLNWDEGTAPHVAWNNSSNTTAIFGGTAGTVTIAPVAITAAGLDITGAYSFDGDPLTLTSAASIASNTTVNFYAKIISSVGLTKTGIGTLALRNNNGINGNLTISGGTLVLGSPTNTSVAGTLGNGSYAGNIKIASGAQLAVRSSSAQTLSGVISGDGTLFKGGGGTLTLSDINTYTGTTTIGSIASSIGAGILSVSSLNSVGTGPGYAPSASSSLGAPTTVANGTISLSGLASSNVTLKYTGPGETTDRVLSFSYNGSSNRGVDASGSGLIKFVSPVLSGGGTSGSIALSGTGLGEIAGAVPQNRTAGTSSGVVKTGTGTWTLSGANSYIGTTAISGAGKLFINGDQTAATGAVTVAATSTLGGTGIIGGNTTININGKLEFNLSAPFGSHDKLELASLKTFAFAGASTLTITSSGGASTGLYKLVTVPGAASITGSVPATVVLPVGWTADPPQIVADGLNTSLQINITSTGGGGPGPLDNFLISAISSPQTVGTPITGITLTARDASNANATVTSFTGTVNFGGTGGFTGTSATFTAGVLSGVSVTPTNAGSGLTFTVTDLGSGKTGSATFNIQTQYAFWSGGALFDADANGDGVKNGLAFLLGATTPTSAVTQPTVTQAAGALTLNFSMLKPAARGTATLNVQHSRDLGIADPWTTVLVTDANSGPTSGVTYVVGAGVGTTNPVTATVAASEAGGTGKLFGRLQANP